MGCSGKTLLLFAVLLLFSGPLLSISAEETAAGVAAGPSSSGASKFHLRLLNGAGGMPLFRNRQLRSGPGVLQEIRKVVNNQPRVLEVVDFQLDDGDLFDNGNSKRFDDYGHSRFGKRNEFDDYGHSRFGR